MPRGHMRSAPRRRLTGRSFQGLPIIDDPQAFEAFYLRHFERITSFLARRSHDPHEVADLTTEVFLVVLKKAHTFRSDRGSEIGWLYGIARNVRNDSRRSRLRREAASRRLAGRRDLHVDDVGELIEGIDACAPAQARDPRRH